MKVYKSTKKNGHIFFIIYVHLYIFFIWIQVVQYAHIDDHSNQHYGHLH